MLLSALWVVGTGLLWWRMSPFGLAVTSTILTKRAARILSAKHVSDQTKQRASIIFGFRILQATMQLLLFFGFTFVIGVLSSALVNRSFDFPSALDSIMSLRVLLWSCFFGTNVILFQHIYKRIFRSV